MQIKGIFCLLFFLATIGSSSMALAGNNKTENPELAELKKQILEMKRQMNEMKLKYETEINALNEKIDKLHM